jgi:Nuclease A inhibitor-like protein
MSAKKKTRARGRRRARSSPRSAGNPAPPATVLNLARGLAAVARHLPNPMDESTDFFQSFSAPHPSDTPVDTATLHQSLSVGRRYRIDLSPADDFFTNAGDPDNWGGDALGFQLLEKVMRATLTDLSVAVARADGVIRVRMWLFGRFPDGWLIGLHSTITET